MNVNPSEDSDYKPSGRAEMKAHRRREHIQAFNMSEDTSIRNGLVPFSERQGTDRFWCFLFLAMIATMIGLSIYGFAKGNVELLLAPVDGNNRICGQGDAAQFKYLFFGKTNPSNV